MEEFTKDQKQYAYKRLSEKEKEFISSDDMVDIYQQIGQKNALMLDAVGKIGNVAFLGLVGLIKSSDIRTRLINTGIPGSVVDSVVNDLNERVFVPFRKVLAEEISTNQFPEKAELPKKFAPVEESSTEMSRDSILSEIENPTPVIHPISAADQTIAGPMIPREIVPEPAKDAVSKDFIAKKLAETVEKPVQKSQTYSADPYREPIS